MSPRHRSSAGPSGRAPGQTRRRLAGARTIRARVAIILAVPTALIMGLVAAGILGQIRTGERADATVSDVRLVLDAQELIHSLQRERGLTSGMLGGAARYRPQVRTQRRATDGARAALDRRLAGAAHAGTDGGGDAGAGTGVRGALGKLSTLGEIRASVDAGRMDRAAALDYYTGAITALNGSLRDLTSGGRQPRGDRELAGGLEALQLLGDAKEATALERGHLNGVFAQGSFTQADYIRFTEIRGHKLDALDRFRAVASARRRGELESALRTPQAATAATFEGKALAGARGERLKVSAPDWWNAMTVVVDDMRVVQRGIGDDAMARAHALKDQAVQRLVIYGAGGALALAVALLLWLYTFRSIVRPLRRLSGEANEAAERTLPAAVARVQAAEEPGDLLPVLEPSALERRGDEFAEVAGALSNLQRTAVRLAAEQAVMRRNSAESLAHLGRRNQNLVRRQLGFISTLEREEADPGALADLFELDHLATRMRRNAESLLVLAGEYSPRRWSGPVPVADVLRSACAEVEDYRRVTLRRMDEARVRGSAAAGVSHLLAELIENALAFSPPDREVEVMGQVRIPGSEYHIAIVDHGVGMPSEAMAIANTRLRGEQSFLVAPTRDLGHYVVGRLAERLGIRVWLHDSPLTGVTARIVLPESLLVTGTDAAVPPETPALPAARPAATAITAPAPPAPPRTPPPASRPVTIVPEIDAVSEAEAVPETESVPGTGAVFTTPPAAVTSEISVEAVTGPTQMTGPLDVAGMTGTRRPPEPVQIPVPRMEPIPVTGAVALPPRPEYTDAVGNADGRGDTNGIGTAEEPEHADWPGNSVGPENAPRATTRNGLVKRVKGEHVLRRPVRETLAPAGSPPPERARDVRSMLESFRSGTHGTSQERSPES